MNGLNNDDRDAIRKLASIGAAGFAAGLSLAICLLAGVYADKWLGTAPVFTITGILLGISAAFYTLIKAALDSRK